MNTWPQADTDRLVALWNDTAGHSAATIAAMLTAELGRPVSRSMVLAKAFRLRERGVELRAKGNDPHTTRRAVRTSARTGMAAAPDQPVTPFDPAALDQPRPGAPEPSDITPPDWPGAERCLWLHGDVREGTARFCAAPVTNAPVLSIAAGYCAFHAALVVTPSPDTRRKFRVILTEN